MKDQAWVFWFGMFLVAVAASALQGFWADAELKEKDQAIAEKCKAAKETVLDEGLLVQAGHVRPGDQLTDRWKTLLAGCE